MYWRFTKTSEMVSVAQCPYGYLFVDDNQRRCTRYVSRCFEICFSYGQNSAVLRCEMFDIDRKAGSYALMVYDHESPSNLIIASVVYYNEEGGQIYDDTSPMQSGTRFTSREVIAMLHVVLFMTMINDKLGVMLVKKDGTARMVREGHYWHTAARPDGKFLVLDDMQGRLWLMETATGNTRLLATGIRDTVHTVHAHASFDRLGRYVQFHTGRTHETVATIDLGELPPLNWTK